MIITNLIIQTSSLRGDIITSINTRNVQHRLSLMMILFTMTGHYLRTSKTRHTIVHLSTRFDVIPAVQRLYCGWYQWVDKAGDRESGVLSMRESTEGREKDRTRRNPPLPSFLPSWSSSIHPYGGCLRSRRQNIREIWGYGTRKIDSSAPSRMKSRAPDSPRRGERGEVRIVKSP